MNTFITCYFNRFDDPQRGIKWEADYKHLEKLYKSLKGENLVIITDCLPKPPKDWKNVTHVYQGISRNPYYARWIAEYEYLIAHPEITKVFLVDATDVEMLQNPFKYLEHEKLYIGDEKMEILGCDYMVKNHPYFAPLFQGSQLTLLNIGLVGGYTEIVIPLLFDFNMLFMMYGDRLGMADMGAFNLLLHTKYKDAVVHGLPVNTHFNKFEKDSKAWLKHK